MIFFHFSEVFRAKVFCTVSYSHVIDIIRLPIKFHVGLSMSGRGGRRGKNGFIQKMWFYVGWNCVGSLKIKETYTKKHPRITGKLRIAMWHTFIRKHPRKLVLPTQLQIFIKISRIGFPGNQVKIFTSWVSASLTESKKPIWSRKISAGKNLASRNSAYLYHITYIWYKLYQTDI